MHLEDVLYPFLKAYKSLPYPLKYFLGRCYGLIPKRIKYGKFYYLYHNRITKTESGIDVVDALLKEQMEIAKNKVPYYMNKHIDSFQDFPIVNKVIVRSNFELFVNGDSSKKLMANSGGSSGTPFEFYLEKGVSRPKEKAHFDWYWHKFGFRTGDRILVIRGESLPNNKLFEYQAINNQFVLSCYLLNKDNVSPVISRINKFGPKYIHAYPSALKNFITLVKESNEFLKCDIASIFLGSEGLLDTDRQKIDDFFHAPIASWYGHSERLVHAGNCPFSTDFHIFPFYGFVELVDKEGGAIVKPNIRGRIIATGFDNAVMPFIRYDTEDEASYSEHTTCKCGFRGRSFGKIYGRRQDYVYLSDSSKVSLTAFIFGQHFEEFSVIEEIQLEQESAGRLTVRLRIRENNKIDTSLFVEKLLNSVDHKLKIEIEIVDFIEKTSRGKHVFLIQKIKSIEEEFKSGF